MSGNGLRIKFEKDGTKMVSKKIYSDGVIMVRIHLDVEKMWFQLVDPVTNNIHVEGGDVSNYEVLLRKAKRELKKLLPTAQFDKEKRNVVREG